MPGGPGTSRLVIEVVDSSTPPRRILRDVTIEIAPSAQSGGETSTATVGGTGGNAFTLGYCPAGSVATALKGRAGDSMDRTELWCSPFAPNGYGAASLVASIGGFGGNPYDFSCPAGMALTGIYGTAGDVFGVGTVVDTIGARCRNLISGGAYQSGTAGNPAGTPAFVLDCPPGKAVVSFFGRQGQVLDQIGLVCR
jgi:hypothetical protein